MTQPSQANEELLRKLAQERLMKKLLDMAQGGKGAPGFTAEGMKRAEAARAMARERGQGDIVPTVAFGQEAAGTAGMLEGKEGRGRAITGWTGEGTAKGFRRQAAENVAEQGRREGEPTPKRRRLAEKFSPTLDKMKDVPERTPRPEGGGLHEASPGMKKYIKDVESDLAGKKLHTDWREDLEKKDIASTKKRTREAHKHTQRRLKAMLKKMDPADRFIMCGPDGCKLTRHVKKWNNVIRDTYEMYGLPAPGAKTRQKRYPWPTMKDW